MVDNINQKMNLQENFYRDKISDDDKATDHSVEKQLAVFNQY